MRTSPALAAAFGWILFALPAAAGPQLNQAQPMPASRTVQLSAQMDKAPPNRPITPAMVAARQEVAGKLQQLTTGVAQLRGQIGRFATASPQRAAAQFDVARGYRQMARFYVKTGDTKSAAHALSSAAASYRAGAQTLYAASAFSGAVSGAPHAAKAHNAEIAAARFERRAEVLTQKAAAAPPEARRP